MDKNTLQKRTKEFSLRIINLVNNLPDNIVGRNIANQLVRSGMSVGANYRASCRGRSKAEFIAKLGIVLEEVDECKYWLEIIEELKLITKNRITAFYKEADELSAVFYVTLKTSKKSKC